MVLVRKVTGFIKRELRDFADHWENEEAIATRPDFIFANQIDIFSHNA